MVERDFDVEFWRDALERQLVDFHSGVGYAFSIFERTAAGVDGPLLGYVNFGEVVRGVFLACYMGYALAEGAQGKGYMTEACYAGISFMFNEVRLHRIMANYMPQNVRSAAVLRKLGFTIEGSASAYLYLAGRWQDHVLTSLTNPTPRIPDSGP